MSIQVMEGSGGVRLVVHEYGRPDGAPIIFLHGLSSSHLAWAKQYGSQLADEFRLICLDLRGHGMSEKPSSSDAYTDASLWAEDIAAVIATLKLKNPILVGWSYGGYVVNDYLAKYGDQNIGGLHYVSAGVLLNVPKADNTFGTGFTGNIGGLLSDNLEDNINSLRPFLRAMFAEQPKQDDFEAMLAWHMVVPPAVRLGLVSRSIDRDETLRGLTVPTLVAQGEKDDMVLSAHTAHLLSCISHAQSSVYANVGHAIPIESPERFNRELTEFARQNAG